MSHLYLKEYTRHLKGHPIAIACREGVLRDHLAEVSADLKLLARQGLTVTLFHNLPPRTANRTLLDQLQQRLPQTRLVRISAEVDFYRAVLGSEGIDHKLIFLERQPLLDREGQRINTLTTRRLRQLPRELEQLVANVNFHCALHQICGQIEAGICQRVHILPASRHAIRDELFTVEGSGTMIANNFAENFRPLAVDEIKLVERILAMYKRSGFLKSRPRGYVTEHLHRFFVTVIDGIIVGCVERKRVDEETVELGALAISTKFRNQRIGVYTVRAFVREMTHRGCSRCISLTRNPRLQELLEREGFAVAPLEMYAERRAQSPGVPLYYRDIL